MYTGLSSRLPVSSVKNKASLSRIITSQLQPSRPFLSVDTAQASRLPLSTPVFFNINSPVNFAGHVFALSHNNGSLVTISQFGSLTAALLTSNTNFAFSSNNGQYLFGIANDASIGRNAAANIRLGAADAAAPVAQTLSVQSAVAGTSNANGAIFTIEGSESTGSGVGGSIAFKTSPAGSSGTAQNALVTAFTINGDGTSTFAYNQYGALGTAAGVVISLPRSYSAVYNG